MVDLRSDTVTRPGPQMRRAIAEAEVGDDVLGDDPTVKRLEEKVAALMGKEAGLFFPSGTQANEAAIAVHTRPGCEVIVEEHSHIFCYEAGGPAVFSGAQLRPIPGERGIITRAQVEAALRPSDPHCPPTRLVCLENTHNSAGGVIFPLAVAKEIGEFCRKRGIGVHLDGARLLNAVVASGVSAASYAAVADTVTLCLSKGLGAPVGTCLAGPKETVKEARWWRKRLGGGMRQVGILAAAGLYALEHNVDRLAEDHANAKKLAEGLAGMTPLRVNPAEVETNMVVIHIDPSGPSGDELVAKLEKEGVLILSLTDKSLRAVTHLDLSASDIDEAIAAFRRALAG